jgi:hypothetical protein
MISDSNRASLNGARKGDATSMAIMLLPSGSWASIGVASRL